MIKISILHALPLLMATLISTSALAQAGTTAPVLGKQMSAAELKQYANAPSVKLGNRSFKIVESGTGTRSAQNAQSSKSNPHAITRVINEQGVVGESRNELVISQVDLDTVRQAVGNLDIVPVSAKYYDSVGISSLRFASFEDAVAAQTKLAGLLPQARIDVPIRYGKPKIR